MTSKLKKTLLPDLLITPRVVLRRHAPEFSQAMYDAIDGDRDRLRVFLPWVDQTKSIEDTMSYIKTSTEKWDQAEFFDYSLFLQKTGSYIGNIGAHTLSWDHRRCEVGYWISGGFEGQGYMSESMMALEKVLFEVGFNRIEIHCSSANERSASVPRRAGYRLEGRLRQDRFEEGGYTDTLIFGKLASDLTSIES